MTTERTPPVPLSFGYDAPKQDAEALAREAMEQGHRELGAGDYNSAVRWLDRGCRLLPCDPTLKLLLATACLRADPNRAKALFRELAETHDGPEVRAGLAAAGLPLPKIELQPHRIEGFVESTEDEVFGWAWHPHDPDRDPMLAVVPSNGRGYTIIATEPAQPIPGMLLGRPRAFRIWRKGLGKRVRILDADGCDLPGSPIVFSATPSPKAPEPRDNPRRPEAIRFRAQQQGRASVLIITHADGGGVERRIMASVAAHEAAGRRAVVLRPDRDGGVRVSDGDADFYPNLRFDRREHPALLRLLRGAKPVQAEIHHLLGHDTRISEIPDRLGVPYSVHIHDHGWICPRVVLIDPAGRYCGEPDARACDVCIARGGVAFDAVTSIAAYRDRSRRILAAAERVIAPSTDTAVRLRRYMPAQPVAVTPHEGCEPQPATPSRVPHHICVVGAIGIHKGFRMLLDCAEEAAARKLPLRFTVVGTTIDDAALMCTGRVFVTGGFAPEEADRLIRGQRAALGWLPSIWPETWCFALSDAWRAGLNVAVFDIGAQAERVRATGRGTLLPLGLSPMQINDALLALSFA